MAAPEFRLRCERGGQAGALESFEIQIPVRLTTGREAIWVQHDGHAGGGGGFCFCRKSGAQVARQADEFRS